MDVHRPISRHRTIILPLTHLVWQLFVQNFQQIIQIRTWEGTAEGGEVGFEKDVLELCPRSFDVFLQVL